MTAHIQGQRLLGQIAPTKNLGEILLRLIAIEAEQVHTPAQTFNLAPIDACIAKAQSHRSYITNLSNQPVIELSSTQHGAGKTQLLYTIITMAILPETYHDVNLQGSDGAVVVLDADHRFDVARLVDGMKCHVRACWDNAASTSEVEVTMASRQSDGKNITDSNQMQVEIETVDQLPVKTQRELDGSMLDYLIGKALDHVHIFRPNSLKDLISTINQLPAYLFDSSKHRSYDRQFRAIILDSADAFYWDYRADQDSYRATRQAKAQISAAEDSTIKSANEDQEDAATYRQLVHELRIVSKTLSTPIIATVTNQTTGTNISNERSEFTDQRSASMLPTPWYSLPTLRFQVGREPVTRFAPYISVDQALRERADRQKVVDQARFVARTVDGHGGFDFSITGDGVKVDAT